MTFPSNRFELVTLMALLKHNFALYYRLIGLNAVLGFLEIIPGSDPNRLLLPDVGKAIGDIWQIVSALRGEPAFAEVPLIMKQVERVEFSMKKGKPPQLTLELKNLCSRMEDLLTGQAFYMVSPDKAQHYESPFLGWGSVCDSFPSAMDAIEEAEKCFALGRSTACVFHCMAVMDYGLLWFGKHLRTGINHDTDTWEKIIGEVQGAINKKRETMKKPAWKAVEPFYSEAVSDLRSVKDAWRNPTMHFRRTYNGEQAEKVLERVRGFMVHLSKRVHEPKRKTSAKIATP